MSGVPPPAPLRQQRPVDGHPRAPAQALDAGIDEVQVGVEDAQRLEVAAIGDPHGLDDPGTGAPRDLVAEGGTLVAVQLHEAQPGALGRAHDRVQRRVDEHTGQLDPAAQERADLFGAGTVQRRLEPGPEDHSSAQAPASAQSCASSSEVMPQSLI